MLSDLKSKIHYKFKRSTERLIEARILKESKKVTVYITKCVTTRGSVKTCMESKRIHIATAAQQL